MNKETPSLSQNIAEYAYSIKFEDLPGEVIHEVKRRIIDSLGCALGAYESEPGKIAMRISQGVQYASGATLWGTRHKTLPELAAFSNGVLVRYLDYNDTYLSKEPAHPSDNIAAALAVAEAEKADGMSLITSIILGYEIQCRLCDAAPLRPGGWDHVCYVSVSSALLASKLMNMDQEGMAHAIALSIAPNIPLRQTRVGELSMWKGCAAANAARNGVFASILAKNGMTGPAEIFEGGKGFFNLVSGPFELDIAGFGGKDGNFKILDTYIKYYPSEYHSQAGIEACLEIRDKVRIEDIEEINIETYDACVDIIAGEEEKWRPKTRETADHSLPYCVAVSLYDGKVGLEQFSEERIKDPKLQLILNKIKVKRNQEHSNQYPKAFPCLVEIRCKTGETFSKIIDYPKGHPKNPLSDREVEGKFKTLSNGLIRGDRQDKIIDLVWRLDKVKDIKDLIKLIKI